MNRCDCKTLSGIKSETEAVGSGGNQKEAQVKAPAERKLQTLEEQELSMIHLQWMKEMHIARFTAEDMLHGLDLG